MIAGSGHPASLGPIENDIGVVDITGQDWCICIEYSSTPGIISGPHSNGVVTGSSDTSRRVRKHLQTVDGSCVSCQCGSEVPVRERDNVAKPCPATTHHEHGVGGDASGD